MTELYRDAGLAIAWAPPDLPSKIVDSPDVSGLPGARVVGAAAYQDEFTTVRAGCVRGPSDRFVQGLEGVLFDKATWFMLRAADARTTELATTGTAGEIQAGLVEETRSGRVDTGATLAMHSTLTFVGEDRDVLLCSAICTTRASAPCPSIVAALRVEGAHAGLPEPSLWMRAVFFTAERPLVGGVIAGALFLVAATVLALRRPRRRRLT